MGLIEINSALWSDMSIAAVEFVVWLGGLVASTNPHRLL